MSSNSYLCQGMPWNQLRTRWPLAFGVGVELRAKVTVRMNGFLYISSGAHDVL